MKTIINWGWCPVVITTLAVLGFVLAWPIEVVAPSLIIILGVGLVIAVIGAKRQQLELSSLRLRQLADYFNRRFMGVSSLSIFAIIDSLLNMNDPKLWEWVRACDMSRRVFDTWCSSFVNRITDDTKSKNLGIYLNEMWSINDHYYEYITQFYEVAQSVEIPRETAEQYKRFVMEYNAFAQNFRDKIGELRQVTKTSIDPPSVKSAEELVR